MKGKNDIPRDGTRVSFRDDGCFVCGPENPVGLKCEFIYDRENGSASTTVTFTEKYQGWDGVVHGGVLTAVLDDVMAHAILTTDHLALTTRMNVTFRKAVRVGEEVCFEGMVKRLTKRTAETTAVAYTLENEGSGEKVVKVKADAVYFLDSPLS